MAPGPRRGRPSVTTRDAIRAAALRVLDRDGASGLTIRGVARELGINNPRLYTHIRDHEELVTLAYEAAEAELEELHWDPPAEGSDWRDGLRAYAQTLQQHLTHHPALIELSLRNRFFPSRGRGPLVLEQIVLSAEAEGIGLVELARAFEDITALVISLVAFRARRSTSDRHDQLARDSRHIAEDFPAAGRLLHQISDTAPHDIPSGVVEDVIRRLEGAGRQP